MKILLEIINILLPAAVTGIFTFWTTKYAYSKDVPLQKMEIAYNRIYYPLYNLLQNIKYKNLTQEEKEQLYSQISNYLKKYNKYADRTTMRLFKVLCIKDSNELFENFCNNIYDRCSFLRRKLGYLEPNILKIYTYLPRNEKLTLNIILLFTFTYISATLIGVTNGVFQQFFIVLCFISFIFLIYELICKFITFIFDKIRQNLSHPD